MAKSSFKAGLGLSLFVGADLLHRELLHGFDELDIIKLFVSISVIFIDERLELFLEASDFANSMKGFFVIS